MLESTGGGLDQSAATRKRRHCGYVGDGCLTSGRGVIFPDSYRPGDACLSRLHQIAQFLLNERETPMPKAVIITLYAI